MSAVQDLSALQTIDNEVSAVRAALSDVQYRLQGDAELDDARRTMNEAETKAAGLRREQRRVEGEVQTLNAKIEPEEKRLYDGSVKNPKELTAIQQELDSLKKHRAEFEEELLSVMSQAETADREVAARRRTVANLEARWEIRSAELKVEAARLQDVVALVDQKRERQKSSIPPRDLAIYEDLRKRKGGMAVAKLQGGVCLGCRIQVPEGIRRRVFAPTILAQCPSCDRILAVG